MTAKQFLSQARRIDKRIDNYVEEITQLLTLATKTTPSNAQERVQSSGTGDKVGDGASKIADLQKEMDRWVDELLIKKEEIRKVIEQVDDTDCYDLLYKRYILYKKWEQIAVDKDITTMGVWKMHGRALKKVEKILESLL